MMYVAQDHKIRLTIYKRFKRCLIGDLWIDFLHFCDVTSIHQGTLNGIVMCFKFGCPGRVTCHIRERTFAYATYRARAIFLNNERMMSLLVDRGVFTRGMWRRHLVRCNNFVSHM